MIKKSYLRHLTKEVIREFMQENIDPRKSWVVLHDMGHGWYPQMEDAEKPLYSDELNKKNIHFSIFQKGKFRYFVFPSNDDATKAKELFKRTFDSYGGSWPDVKWSIGPAYNYLSSAYHKDDRQYSNMDFLLGYEDDEDDADKWKRG